MWAYVWTWTKLGVSNDPLNSPLAMGLYILKALILRGNIELRTFMQQS